MTLFIFTLIERSLNGPFLSVTFMFIEIYSTQGQRWFILALSGLAYLIQISLYLADILPNCLSFLFSLEHRVFFPDFYSLGDFGEDEFWGVFVVAVVFISVREESGIKMAFLHHL